MTPEEQAAAAQMEALKRVLHATLGATGLGLAARAGLAALSPSTHVNADVPRLKKVIIPLPAPPTEESPEGERRPEKLADDNAITRTFPGLSDWLSRNVPERTPMSGVMAKTPEDVPWMPVGAILGPAAGLAGGWALGDKAVRAYQRHRAKKELEASRKAYQDEILASYGTDKPAADADYEALAAGGEPADHQMRQAQRILETAWKSAQVGWPEFERSWLYGLGFPGTLGGSTAAAANLLAILGSAGIGGYAGYSHIRNDAAQKEREAIEAAGKKDLEERSPVLVGEIRPPPKLKSRNPVSLARRLAKLD